MGIGRGRQLVSALLGSLLMTMPAQRGVATPQEVLLLRHGHKDIQRGDSNLSPQGLQRMQALAPMIPACFGAPTGIVVYPFDRVSGKNARSYQSAVPLAVATGLLIRQAETAPEQSEQVGRSILSDPGLDGGRVVMIWEHRRLQDLAKGLGWPSMPPIADDDFDHLDLLRYSDAASPPTVVRYSQAELLRQGCGLSQPAALSREDAPHRRLSTPAEGVQLNLEALKRRIGPPPAAGSQAAENDLVVLRWLQKSRTPLQVASSWILLDRDPSLFNIALGVDLSQSAPRLMAGLKAFLEPVDQAKNRIKDEIRRPRPFVAHQDLKPCLPREHGFSYPSGHSSWYSAASILLADLLPARTSRLHWIGRQGGFNRSLCGVHYPSDVVAGERLGVAAAQQLIASEAWQRFRSDPGLQAELRRILAIPDGELPPLLH